MSAAASVYAGGVCIRDDFLAPTLVRALVGCIVGRQARGDFGAARIGAGARLQRDAEIRGDFTCWLDEPLFAAERELLEQLEQLRLALNREMLLGLFELEAHYACYPAGARYGKHVDQHAGNARRKVSLVLYLNEAWHSADGGALRMFGARDYVDIEPMAGRLVYFLSEGAQHAVMPAGRERLSISGWFRTRA